MFEQIRQRNRQLVLRRPLYRKACASAGAWINRLAYRLVRVARSCVRFMNHHVTHAESDWFVQGIPGLHRRIDEVLKRQRKEYGSYYYFYGYPYQALGILGVYGERPTEERFDAYRLRDLVGPSDKVLDIGCNCGFMALYLSYRTGCRAVGIDVNPYMIEIGNLCADYLRVSDRVELSATRIQDFAATGQFTIVLSFATHWTDDKNYRVPIREHFERCAGYLQPSGILVFESHAADVGKAEFYEAIDSIADLFSLESKRDTDRGTRHLYVFRKHSV